MTALDLGLGFVCNGISLRSQRQLVQRLDSTIPQTSPLTASGSTLGAARFVLDGLARWAGWFSDRHVECP
jgi:hypothetical protein